MNNECKDIAPYQMSREAQARITVVLHSLNTPNNFDKRQRTEVDHSTMVSILASGPSCPGFDSQHSQKNSEKKLLMLLLLRYINYAA